MNVFDPMKSMNALAGGMELGSHIRDKQTMNALAPMVAKGDYKSAMEYAGSRGDLGMVNDMRTQYEAQVANLDEQSKAAERKRIEGLARIAYGGRQYNDEALTDYVRSKAPELTQLGMTQEQVADLVHNGVTRKGLEEFITALTPIEEFWKKPTYFAPTETTGSDGNPVLTQFANDGSTPITAPVSPYQKPEGPLSPIGNLVADLNAGRITPEQYDAEVARQSKSGQTININGPQAPSQYAGMPDGTRVDAPPGTKDLPAGQVYEVRDGRLTIQNLSGSEAERTAKEDERKRLGKQADTEQAGRTVVREVGRGLQLMPNVIGWGKSPTPGGEEYAGGAGEIATANARVALSQIPGTSEFLFKKHIDSALSNVGLDKLQSMRDNSPTGGALGQVPIQQQKRLEQVLGSFDIALPRTVTEENLKYLNNAYMDIMYGSEEERQFAIQEGKLSSEENDRIQQNYYNLNWNEFGRFEPPPEGFQIVE
jgi:hypothetical protein